MSAVAAAKVRQGLNKVYRFRGLPRLMGHVLKKEGWAPRSSPADQNWTLFWKNGRYTPTELSEATQPQHTLNHFPETYHLTKKYGDIYDFFPKAFVYTNYSQQLLSKYFDKPGRLWIGKPAASSQGRGIHLTDHLSYFSRFLAKVPTWERKAPAAIQRPAEAVEEQGVATEPTAENAAENKGRDVVVIQEYIHNPFLIRGYKFDLRIYVLVTSFKPLRAYLYLDGLARFCTKKYSTTDFDLLRHLTNTSIHTKVFDNGNVTQEEIDQFRSELTIDLGQGDFSKWRLRALLAYLKKAGYDHEAVWNRIRNVIRLTLLPLAHEMPPPKQNSFELFGFDILLTDDLKPKLIEVNLAPSLGVSCSVDRVVKEPMLVDLLNIVFEDPAKPTPFPKRVAPIAGPNSDFTEPLSRGDFELLFPFDEETTVAANMIACNVNAETNMKRIMDKIHAQYK